jgi:hypothetical protein
MAVFDPQLTAGIRRKSPWRPDLKPEPKHPEKLGQWPSASWVRWPRRAGPGLGL